MHCHSTRLLILEEVDNALKGAADPKYPSRSETLLRAALYEAWDKQLLACVPLLRRVLNRLTEPTLRDVDEVIDILRLHLSGKAITKYLSDKIIRQVFASGQGETSNDYKRLTGRQRKVRFGFGAIFGLTESHAIKAISDFLFMSAGGFWDNEMTAIVRHEMNSWFEGAIDRKKFSDNLRSVVNDRLAIDGKNSKPKSYFDFLAVTNIVTARSAGKIYRGKELGAVGYRYANPDPKTEVCKDLTKRTDYFPFNEVEKELSVLLQASSLAELKEKLPFNASRRDRAVPPLHPYCKTYLVMVYKGIND